MSAAGAPMIFLEHICKIIELYEFFSGTYGLGRRNVDGSVGSPFLSFAKGPIAGNIGLLRENFMDLKITA